MEKLKYKDILSAEEETAYYTRSRLKGVNNNIPNILDSLSGLLSFTGPSKDVSTLEGKYHSYCWHQYLSMPYSFRACFMLYERGYYLEATFILRHSMEVLAKLRYLKNHNDLVSKMWTGKKIEIVGGDGKKKKLTLRDIFEEVAPGYYDPNYGELFSGFQHGGIGTTLFHVEYKSSTEGKIKMGATWDEQGATFIINNFIALCYGWLNYFPIFFPEGFGTIDEDSSQQYQTSMRWLDEAMDSHKKTHPKSVNWYNEMDALIKGNS